MVVICIVFFIGTLGFLGNQLKEIRGEMENLEKAKTKNLELRGDLKKASLENLDLKESLEKIKVENLNLRKNLEEAEAKNVGSQTIH